MPYTGRLIDRPLLDIIQIVAYSQQSGLLSVKGAAKKGLIIFDGGGVVCAYAPGSLPLLVKAAKEAARENALPLRRVAALAALRELFELAEGEYRFVRRDEPLAELEGLAIRGFYQQGALDTGDLLLALEKAMDQEPAAAREAVVKQEMPTDEEIPERAFERFGPVVIKATLSSEDTVAAGYLTNLSEGGTFFHAEASPRPGSVAKLEFDLPWELGYCQAKATVVWVRSEGPNNRRGAGLSFLELAPQSRGKLASYLERFRETAAEVETEAEVPDSVS